MRVGVRIGHVGKVVLGIDHVTDAKDAWLNALFVGLHSLVLVDLRSRQLAFLRRLGVSVSAVLLLNLLLDVFAAEEMRRRAKIALARLLQADMLGKRVQIHWLLQRDAEMDLV